MTDKQTVMSWLEGLAQDGWPMFHSESEVRNTAKAALELLKLSEPVRHGHWELSIIEGMYICSNCRKYYIRTDEAYEFNYCPRCGAKMDEVSE